MALGEEGCSHTNQFKESQGWLSVNPQSNYRKLGTNKNRLHPNTIGDNDYSPRMIDASRHELLGFRWSVPSR
jgi:hypothetical protein